MNTAADNDAPKAAIPHRARDWSHFGLVGANAFVAAAYLIAALIGFFLSSEVSGVSTIWPPSGVALAALVWWGFRVAPGILLAALAVNFWVFQGSALSTYSSAGVSLAFAIGNTIEAAVGAQIIHRLWGWTNPLRHARGMAILSFAVVASSALNATFGVTGAALIGLLPLEQFIENWLAWWLGGVAGAMIVAPLILAWAFQRFRDYQGDDLIYAGVILGLLFVTTQVAFGGWGPGQDAFYPIAFLPLPFLVWLAYRFGQRGATAGLAVLATVVILGTLNHRGQFAPYPDHQAFLLLHLYLACTAGIALFLASVVKEWQAADSSRRAAQSELEQEIAQHHRDTDLLRKEEMERQRLALDLESFFQLAPDILLIANVDGTIARVNPALTSSLGYTEAAVMGRSLVHLIHDADRELFEQTVNGLREGEASRKIRARARDNSGELHWLDWHLMMLPDQDRIYAAAEDDSDRLNLTRQRDQLRNRVERQATELERYTYAVTHRMREPIDQLLQSVRSTDQISEVRPQLERTGERMQRLLEGLKELVHIGLISAEKSVFDMQHAVNDAQSKLQKSIDDSGAKIEIEGFLPTAYGDRSRITRVWIELLSNAIKFGTDDQDPIEIRIGGSAGKLENRYFITDNGRGVESAQQQRIFDVLHQQQADSDGLGLAAVKRIIEVHGGDVWVQSMGRNRGATFEFTLPNP